MSDIHDELKEIFGLFGQALQETPPIHDELKEIFRQALREKSPIHDELKEIFRRALQEESPEERKELQRRGMARMLEAPKKCFWPHQRQLHDLLSNDLLYIEAANVAWDYIERKIYGNVRRGEAYDPDKGGGSPITLWNKRCKGEYLNRRKKQHDLIETTFTTPNSDTPYGIIEQQPLDVPLLELVRQEIENDPTGELRSAFIRQTPPPPITAQEALLVIYDRTACGEKWTNAILAEHFNIAEGTVLSAWGRTLKPLLKKIGDRIRDSIKEDL
ncbi:hypothetical protein [Sphaerospermopsis torques-reginae]|uniref:Uncharacterized protein n=1 Tax=Sphaerospermopsis torques-reginae ITEP-024 TaxID=984208 RepID=A0ABX8WVS6_9CYAN|nr:hypothetical protein [Sphaerospermopsis torques-reginae]QYX30520.1 hypothetical protein K2F26_16680 [Sphaerospermopsis torques-reginae ITEP-024]